MRVAPIMAKEAARGREAIKLTRHYEGRELDTQQESHAELVVVVRDLEAQLKLMRGLHEALLARLVSVEAKLQHGKVPPEPSSGARPMRKVPSRRDMLAVLQQPSADAPATPTAAAAPVDAATPAATAAPAATPAPAPAAAAPAAGPTSAAPTIAWPPQADLVQCLHMLAAEVTLSVATTPFPATLADFFMAPLLDASAEVVGVILTNPRAGADLGGGLMGLAAVARDDQAQRGLEKDTLEGLNEICNNLGGLINRVNPTCYTKLKPVEQGGAAAVPWLAKPGKTLGFSTPNGGALWFAAR